LRILDGGSAEKLDDSDVVMGTGTEIRCATKADFAQIEAIRREAFRRPTRSERWLNGTGRVLASGEEVQGIVQTETLGQYFGGKRVPFAAITSVAVGVPHRNQGVARNLLGAVLREAHADRVAMTALFPSSPALYRGLGFELAGSRVVYTVPAGRDRSAPLSPGLTEQWSEWSNELLPEISTCYETFAADSSGLLARTPEWWAEYVADDWSDREYFCQRVYDGDDLVGYAIYYQQLLPGRTPYDFTLRVRDMAWLSGPALHALIRFLSGQWPYQLSLSWTGPAHDPVARTFSAPLVDVESSYPWMARIVNAEAALHQRGYPTGISAAIRLTIRDPLLVENSQSLLLEIENGVASLSSSTQQGIGIDITTLTALYTGWLHPQDAARLGLLENATSHDIQTLGLLFNGPSPWIPEFF
jgi:predicted acetyltransferase